jgi:hypothetical protein
MGKTSTAKSHLTQADLTHRIGEIVSPVEPSRLSIVPTGPFLKPAFIVITSLFGRGILVMASCAYSGMDSDALLGQLVERIKSEKAITPLAAFDRSLSVKTASERALEVGKALSVKWKIILVMLD